MGFHISSLIKEFKGKDSESMATKFTPLHDRILARRVEEVGTTRGGIIIPDSAKDKPQEGAVMAVGKGKTNDEGKVFPLALKEGDCILFGKYSGTEIKIDGEDFLIMKEEEVLGVISGAARKETVGAKK
jgi:chaperonin GroES